MLNDEPTITATNAAFAARYVSTLGAIGIEDEDVREYEDECAEYAEWLDLLDAED
jgi:hypothetical protein